MHMQVGASAARAALRNRAPTVLARTVRQRLIVGRPGFILALRCRAFRRLLRRSG